MKEDKISGCLEKYLKNQASAEEVKLVDEWYQSFSTKPGLTEQLSEAEQEQALSTSFAFLRRALGIK